MPPYFIADGPTELTRLNDQDAHLNEDLRALCQKAPDEAMLHRYLDKTCVQHQNLRDIIQDEIESRRFNGLWKQGRKSHEIVRWTFIVSVMILAVTYLAWMLPRSSAGSNTAPTSPQSVVAPLSAHSNSTPAVSTQSVEVLVPKLLSPSSARTNSVVAPTFSTK
jgi:hypothetical protein